MKKRIFLCFVLSFSISKFRQMIKSAIVLCECVKTMELVDINANQRLGVRSYLISCCQVQLNISALSALLAHVL